METRLKVVGPRGVETSKHILPKDQKDLVEGKEKDREYGISKAFMRGSMKVGFIK